MRKIVIILLLFCAGKTPAQNLLPNPSFEDTIQLSFGRTFARNWKSPNTSAPEHYNPNSRLDWRTPKNYTGFQYAHSGSSYFGVKVYTLFASKGIRSARDYMQCKIEKELIKDSTYCLQLYISLADSCNYASKNQLSAKFSNIEISSNSTANLNEITDIVISETDYIVEKKLWIQYNFKYVAKGGEKYLTIGNFNDTNNIDTLYVGSGGDRSNIDYNGTYYFIDDVYLGSCDSLPFDTGVGINEYDLLQRNFKIYPNPTQSLVNLNYEVKANEFVKIQVYNLYGKLIKEEQLFQGDSHKIQLQNLKQGIYIYKLSNEKSLIISGKLIIQ